jgi:DNA-binding CsgD family transcriptional regulator
VLDAVATPGARSAKSWVDSAASLLDEALDDVLDNQRSLDAVVDELAGRFGLTPQERMTVEHLARGGSRASLGDALGVGDDRTRQIVSSLHAKLRTSRADEIASEVALATLCLRSAFPNRSR